MLKRFIQLPCGKFINYYSINSVEKYKIIKWTVAITTSDNNGSGNFMYYGSNPVISKYKFNSEKKADFFIDKIINHEEN